MGSPPVLILDEPTVGLDPLGIADLKERLRALSRQDGTTVLFSSHQLTEVEDLCDAVALINYGEVIHSGSITTLTRDAGYRVQVEDPEAARNSLSQLGLDISADQEGLVVRVSRGRPWPAS